MAGITSKLVYYNKLQMDVKVQLSALSSQLSAREDKKRLSWTLVDFAFS